MIRRLREERGATFVDVVVVVAMLGLLLAMLGPALHKAREQSKVATCLANLRFISQSAASYMEEQGTIAFVFPFDFRTDDGYPHASVALVTEFIWGGGVPDKRRSEWDPNWGDMNPLSYYVDVYCLPPAARPLNEYMVPGVWWNHPLRVRPHPERYQIPMELPDFFKCPSDGWPGIPGGGADPNAPADPNNSTWAWWGTSYTINWYWGYFYSYWTGEPLVGRTYSPGVLDGPRHQEIIRDKLDHGASEWLLFYENGLNFSFEAARPRGYGTPDPRSVRGWHGDHDVHAAGFADGSARYRRFETEYVDGPGWTLWPNRPWDGTIWEPYQGY